MINKLQLSMGLAWVLAIVAVLFVTPSFTEAQSQFGSIVGTIVDPSGARIPGVKVHAANEDSGLGFSTVSGESGDYVIGGLLPGRYTIDAQKSDLKSYRAADILVRAGVSVRVDISMSLGAVQQTVNVTASAAPLSTESGTVVAEASVQSLRTPTFIQATQMPGDVLAPYLPGQNYVGGRAVAAYGSRSYDRRETVDGAVLGFSYTVGMRMPRGSVSALQAVSLVADAEHQTSNTTEMLTSKGTNNFHGSIWTELQNGALNQLPFYALPGTAKPGTPAIGLGFITGGPVYIPKLYNGRDKTFFFVTFQKYWQPIPLSYSGTGASNAMRNGDFSGLGVTIKNPQTGQPFPGAVIPAQQISSIAQNIYNKYFPSIPGAYASPDFPAFNTELNPFSDLFVRGDHQFGSKDLLSATYLHNRMLLSNVPGANSGGTTSGPPTTGLATNPTHLNFFNLSENHIFSTRLLNEANFGMRLGIASVTTTSNDGDSLTSSLLLPSAQNGAPAGIKGGPTFSFTGMSGLSFGSQGSSDGRVWTFRDNLTGSWGRSITKVGFEYVSSNSTSITYSNLFGTYSFSGLFTGNVFADYLLGLPTSTSRALPPGPLTNQQQQIGFYADESLHLARKVTIDAGLRIEYDSSPIEKSGKYYNFDLATGNVVVPNQNSFQLLNPGLSPGILSHIVTADSAKFPIHLVNGLWNIDPRLGVAYQLRDKTILRAGFGTYGVLLAPGAPTGGVFTPGVQNFTNSNTCNAGLCTPAFTLANPFPTNGAQIVSGLSIQGTNPGLRTPQTYQWQLSVEHLLPGAISFRASYVGSHSTQLVYSRNVNLPHASTIPYTTSRLVYPQWFSVTYADSGGNQSFNSLDTEVKRHWVNGLTFDTNYTWAKCLSDDDEGGMIVYGGTGLLGATIENPYDRARDKGNCEATPRNFLRTNFVANSPFGPGQRWLPNVSGLGGRIVNAAIGGWTLSGMFIARTGRYYTPKITGVDSANTGQTLIRPDRICSGIAHPQTATQVFDPKCFVAPPNGRYGNSGTGIINGLGLWQFDSGVYKYFTLANNEYLPKLRVGMNSINTLGHPGKDFQGSSGQAALTINAPATVARASNGAYTNGATANLGDWRHIYFEIRLEW